MNSGSNNVFKFECPVCDKRLKAHDGLIGKKVKCPGCDQKVKVPSAPTPSPSSKTQSPSPQTDGPKKVASELDGMLLSGTAISDLDARNQEASDIRAEKESQRAASRARANNRRESLGPKQPLALPSAADDGLIPFDSDDTLAGQGSEEQTHGEQVAAEEPKADARRSVFDDDLPELENLSADEIQLSEPAPVPPKKLAPSNLGDLDDLIPTPGQSKTKPSKSKKSSGPTKTSATPQSSGSSRASQTPNGPAAASNPPEDEFEEETEFRVVCSTCGTGIYVTPETVGSKVKCPDCFSMFKVPPPPKGWKTRRRKQKMALGDDIALAPAAELPASHTEAARKDRSQVLLEKAAQEVTDEEIEQLYENDFDTAGFIQNTFGFTKDIIVMSQVLGYGIVFSIIFGLGFLAAEAIAQDPDGFFGRGMLMVAFILIPLIALLFAMPMLSGALGLIVSVANKQKRVEELPSFNLFDHLGEIMLLLSSLTFSALPGFMVGATVGDGALIRLIGMMCSCCLLFPLFLLSMLDNNSILAPISTSVVSSIRSAADSWGAYFMKTISAFVIVGIAWLILLGRSPALAAIAGFLLPPLVFFTAQQIGSLANQISDNLTFELTPSEKEEDAGESEDQY